jgi:hypothetical protein
MKVSIIKTIIIRRFGAHFNIRITDATLNLNVRNGCQFRYDIIELQVLGIPVR